MKREWAIPHWEKPCAGAGLLSYRYRNGAFGYVMIGAHDDEDALKQAAASITGEPVVENLDYWNGKKYMPCSAARSAS